MSVVGTVAHFIFEWSGESVAAALFCPINESAWEHLKLLFFPYIIWSVCEYFIFKGKYRIFSGKCAGAVVGMLAILSFFYTYTGICGRNIDWLNILSFFIGIFAAFWCDYVIIKSGKLQSTANEIFAVLIIIAICIMFFLFTFAPPLIPLFKDPLTSTYGL